MNHLKNKPHSKVAAKTRDPSRENFPTDRYHFLIDHRRMTTPISRALPYNFPFADESLKYPRRHRCQENLLLFADCSMAPRKSLLRKERAFDQVRRTREASESAENTFLYQRTKRCDAASVQQRQFATAPRVYTRKNLDYHSLDSFPWTNENRP